MSILRRYGLGARVYDVVSGERLVYRAGRVAGIDALHLSPGDTVLDLGCGTGLNLPLIVDRVGPTGSVVGVDLSPDMLSVARRRIAYHGWRNIRLIQADVAALSLRDLSGAGSTGAGPFPDLSLPDLYGTGSTGADSDVGGPTDANDFRSAPLFDAALSTYAMSVFDDWHPAWELMRSALAPHGRIAIVDMARPVGAGVLLTPLVVLACALGGADLDAAPWTALEATALAPAHSTRRSGHIHVVSGSFP